ncbi:MAG TPA: FAD-binding oxidoreductase [Gemmatimonadaceae bacterium]|nr:FAD-binding oxidoreductase [Gemmatimonadaceae bacterium]
MSALVETDPDVRAMFAADASGLRYLPDGVARPESVEEVTEVVKRAASARTPVTPAGMQTSTTGASITERGILLSLRGLTPLIDVDRDARTVRTSAGAILGEVKRAVAAEGLLFAPDPTSEEESTVGGAIACNASGARTLKYGATREHVRAVTVVLASGEVVRYSRVGLEKNTAGYAFAHDPVDWFVGSEGTLGVVVEAELELLPLPERVIGLEIPFANEAEALAFVVAARESRAVAPRCLEYFDQLAVGIARGAETSRGSSGHSASLVPAAGTMVYVEQELAEAAAGVSSGADYDAALDGWLALAESRQARVDDVRVFDGEQALAVARRIRHAVPATMNERGAGQRASGGRKVSTDWAVPYRRLNEALSASREMARQAGVSQAVTYGHAGNGHPHQNWVARDSEELEAIERVVEQTLRMVVKMGGTVSAEHGIGKLKTHWLPLQMSPLAFRVMRAVKQELDPLGILAPGNIF